MRRPSLPILSPECRHKDLTPEDTDSDRERLRADLLDAPEAVKRTAPDTSGTEGGTHGSRIRFALNPAEVSFSLAASAAFLE